MKKFAALLLCIALMLSGCTGIAETEATPAPYQEIAPGAYQIENGGYLFVGTQGAALFDGAPSRAEVAATVESLANGLEVAPVSTAQPSVGTLELGGFTFTPLAIEGTIEGTAYLDSENGILVSGSLLGNGTVDLSKQAPDAQASWYIDAYRAYRASIDAVGAATEPLEALAICANGAVLDKAYLGDLITLVGLFVDASLDITLTAIQQPGSVGDFSTAYGSATILVHMPFGGLYGYDLGGTTLCTSDDQYRFYICDYGKFQTIRDTDIQSCYVLMDDDEALLIDCDMYNGELFWQAVDKLVGDRSLSVYITHNHIDHLSNLEKIDPDRLATLYWPADEEGPSRGYNPLADERLADKITYLEYDTEYTIASHDIVLCKMTSHSSGGTVVIDKTDRVLFSGDALGTQTYKGGTTTGSLTAEEYLAELDYLTDTYGGYFDDIYQAHNLYSTPKVIDYLKMICEAFIAEGPEIAINGTIYAFDGQILDQERYDAIFGNSLFDSQMRYSIGLGLGPAALEAYEAA